MQPTTDELLERVQQGGSVAADRVDQKVATAAEFTVLEELGENVLDTAQLYGEITQGRGR